MTNEDIIIETHPWAPFVPDNARVLIMGTFPPGEHRWSMDFFYPNPTNDFWRIMGLLYFGDKEALYDRAAKRFRLDDVRHLVGSHGIAMGATRLADLLHRCLHATQLLRPARKLPQWSPRLPAPIYLAWGNTRCRTTA